MSKKAEKEKVLNLTVVVCALGYFVDIYDLLLFGIVRTPSLRDLGVPESEFLTVGARLLNFQMVGMLVGGILWGILGDKRGRLSVLFGSIVMYSLANIANAFVTSVEMYEWLRFIAGVGLAGELGAAITLVSETLSKENRGYGTAIVASVGILGAVFAALVGELFNWKIAYIVGGVMGLALLVMRVKVHESGMFHKLESKKVRKGNFFLLFQNFSTFVKYMRCVLIGVPIWYVVGILVIFAPELSKLLGVQGAVTGAQSVMYTYIGLSLGDLVSGFFSQKIKSRRLSVFVFLIITLFFIGLYMFVPNLNPFWFYAICVGMGFGAGYWAVFVTIAAEQFGTNIRATAATTVPNFVRGMVVPLTLGFQYFAQYMDKISAAQIVCAIAFALAFVSLWRMEETHSKDLNFLEGTHS